MHISTIDFLKIWIISSGEIFTRENCCVKDRKDFMVLVYFLKLLSQNPLVIYRALWGPRAKAAGIISGERVSSPGHTRGWHSGKVSSLILSPCCETSLCQQATCRYSLRDELTLTKLTRFTANTTHQFIHL